MEEWEIHVFKFAQHHHKGQKDKTGNDYFLEHILHVVSILKTCIIENDDYDNHYPRKSMIITACYLHDTIEDTKVTYGMIVANFGKIVADLVMEVTSLYTEPKNCFPRLKTLDGYLIKYADRLSNLSKRKGMSPEHKKEYMSRSIFWKERI